MPNPIKYSVSSQTLALKKGNFWIGTGDVGKGPTQSTDYWNGVTPPSGGYTIYLNKASGGPSIYTAANDASLISVTNRIAGANYTTRNECLNYYMSQTDKIITNMDYPSIITDGLVMSFDSTYTLGYPQNGSTIYDMSGGSSYSGNIYGNQSWANNISELTICLLLTKTNTGTGYANHPINKWNSAYNVNASFILYHFENYFGNGQDGVLGWYGYGVNSGWSNIGTYGFTTMSVGQTFWVALQYNSSSGGQAWVNGTKSGGRSGNNGNLGPTTSPTYDMNIYLPYEGNQMGTGYVSNILFYNRELSDSEMVKNYNALSSRVVV
jgi:hypothetical protein